MGMICGRGRSFGDRLMKLISQRPRRGPADHQMRLEQARASTCVAVSGHTTDPVVTLVVALLCARTEYILLQGRLLLPTIWRIFTCPRCGSSD